MKFLLVLLALAALAAAEHTQHLTDAEKAKLKEYSTACEAESHVDADLLKQLRDGTIADDAKLNKHLFCVNKKIGLQEDNGNVNVEVFRKKIGARVGEDKIEDLVKKCAVSKATGEETAIEMAKCLKANK